jgi:fatty aldehyde-generating acyl-ACP reductase
VTRPPEVALLGHLESIEAYCDLLGAARGRDLPPLRPERLEPVLQCGGPMPICDLRLRSPRGLAITARYIDIGFLGAWLRVVDSLSKVRAGCIEAVRSGARIAALGGFTSILGERHRVDASSEFGIAFTTGNTLTAAVIANQVRALTGERQGAVVAVVGAGGDVGSGVARLLRAHGHTLLLVGRTVAAVHSIAAELDGAEIATWESAAPRADVVVLVASATQGELSLDSVRGDAWVLDAGHPPNARVPVGRYARAGRVMHALLPESDLPELLSLQYRPGESHACLAEAEVLAFEGRWEPFSGRRGQIRPAQADEILALAARHGITPAALTFAP